MHFKMTPLTGLSQFIQFTVFNLLLQDGDHARMNSLTTELVERLFDDVSTSHEAFLRGVRLSGQGF